MKRSHLCICTLFALTFAAPRAAATWSIVVVDTRTREIAIGSATCLLNFDLRAGLPVVRVGLGAAACQSAIDSSGANRRLIWDQFALGTDPAVILQMLQHQDGSFQSRQYGIVDVLGRAVTFTGTGDGAYANGLTGQVGTLVYAIQGNVITGQCVLNDAQRALRDTPGSLPEKLMAAMEAARAMGGDGRCSCSPNNPPACGCPPQAVWRKAAHIGFIIDARRGDVDGQCNASVGCASGTYFMNFNYLSSSTANPDPVQALREQFTPWFQSQIGRPDQIASRAAINPRLVAADADSTALLAIDLRDIQGNPATLIDNVTVTHDTGSAGIAAIGPVMDLGGGEYDVQLASAANGAFGLDKFAINVTSNGVTRTLMPSPTLRHLQRGDLNGDGIINNFDIDPFVLVLTQPDVFAAYYPDIPAQIIADINGDGVVNAFDIDAFVQLLAH